MKLGPLYQAFYETDPAPVVSFLQYLADSYRLGEEPRVLDMGCGTGRLLGPFHQLGWRVTGYEPDSEYRAVAQEVALSLPGVTVRQAGMENLTATAEYDLIVAVGDPYCYVLDMAERRRVIRRCAEALAPVGVLFLELVNFWWVFRNYRDPEPVELEVDGLVVRRTVQHTIDFNRARLRHDDTFCWTGEDGEDHELRKTHEFAMVGLPEILLFMEEAGFEDLRTFNSFADRTPGDETSNRLLVAGRVT